MKHTKQIICKLKDIFTLNIRIMIALERGKQGLRGAEVDYWGIWQSFISCHTSWSHGYSPDNSVNSMFLMCAFLFVLSYNNNAKIDIFWNLRIG
jgi:hypothetical protein